MGVNAGLIPGWIYSQGQQTLVMGQNPRTSLCQLVGFLKIWEYVQLKEPILAELRNFFLNCVFFFTLKVHYATFLKAVNKQKNRVLDARNNSLQELT